MPSSLKANQAVLGKNAELCEKVEPVGRKGGSVTITEGWEGPVWLMAIGDQTCPDTDIQTL